MTSLADSIRNMCLTTDFADVTFVIGDNEIPAHKVVLAARSQVFKKMLFGPSASHHLHPKVVLMEPVMTEIGFSTFLKFIYEKSVELTVDKALSVLHLAYYYDIPAIVKKCKEYLIANLTSDNALIIGEAVYLYNDDLWNELSNFIASHSKEVLATSNFANISAPFAAVVLNCPLTFVEIDLFNMCLPWFEAHKDEKERQLVIKNISFPFMTPKELSRIVYPKKILTSEQYFTALHSASSFTWDEQSEFKTTTRGVVEIWKKVDCTDICVIGDFRLYFAFDNGNGFQKFRETFTSEVPYPKSNILIGHFKDHEWLCKKIYARPCPEGTLFEPRDDAPEDGVLIARFH